MASYVKFKRGTPEAYLRAKESGRLEQDTLYFIFKEGELTADLYLGSRLISTGDSISSDLTELKLASLSDISINEPQAGDILTYNSETLKWENQSVDTLLDSYNPESTVVLVVENEYNNSHDTLIAEECLDFDEKSGDIIIIKDVISNDKYKYTGYIYNGSVWTAFTGNCDANNVYFQEDLIFTSAFGNYIPDTSGNVTVPAKGLSL